MKTTFTKVFSNLAPAIINVKRPPSFSSKLVHKKAVNQLFAFLILSFFYLPGITQSSSSLNNKEAKELDSLMELSQSYFYEGNYDLALELADSNIKKAQDIFGDESEIYAESLNILGLINQNVGEYETAEKLFQEAIEINKLALGENSTRYATSLGNLASLLHDSGQFDEAEKLFTESMAIFKANNELKTGEYAAVVINYAYLLQDMGRYKEAESNYLEGKKVNVQVYGKLHPEYGLILNNLAQLYVVTGKFEKAEEMFLEAIDLNKVVLGPENPDRAYSLLNLGAIYFYQSRFEEALPLFYEARDLRKKSYGDQNAKYANTLDRIASTYKMMGQYKEAERLFLEAKRIRSSTVGEEHIDYASLLYNIGMLYLSMGNYEDAETYFKQTVDIRTAILGTDHSEYALGLNGLASVYQETERYEEAISLLKKAVNVWEKSLGKEHPYYARGLNNLGDSYSKINQYKIAEQYYKEALQIQEKKLGKESSEYMTSLGNLASTHQKLGLIEQASSEFYEAKSLMEKIFSDDNPAYQELITDIGWVEYQMGNYRTAATLLQQSNQIRKKQLLQGYQHLSELELNAYLQKLEEASAIFSSFAFDTDRIDNQVQINALENILFYKGFLLEGVQNFTHTILSANDESLLKKYHQWKGMKRELGKLYKLPKNKRDNFSELAEKAKALEKELAVYISGFDQPFRNVTYADLMENIGSDEAIIEFTHFKYFNKLGKTDSTFYCAYVLRPDFSAPQLVYLFEEKELETLFKNIPAQKKKSLDNLYASRGIVPEGAELPSGKDLIKLAWLPIDTLLEGVTRVYYSPSGILNRINFSALPINKKSTLSEQYEMYQLGSSRQLVLQSGQKKRAEKEAVLLGGIRYDREQNDTPPGAQASVQANETPSNEIPFSPRGNAKDHDYLEGTLSEVKNIGKELVKSGYKVKIMEGHSGTEEAFKRLGTNDASPKILHIATHGYFFPDPATEVESINTLAKSDHPMIRSGLLLAGSNPAWKGEETPPDQEDGILTAYEISQMDLNNTELVVLSACETGLGDIQGNEGVYGLQRAFKIAGAKYLIMSLWDVPDEETAEFMTTFYQEWLGGKDIHNAFRKTQQIMRADYLDEPFLWAGFVLVE